MNHGVRRVPPSCKPWFPYKGLCLSKNRTSLPYSSLCIFTHMSVLDGSVNLHLKNSEALKKPASTAAYIVKKLTSYPGASSGAH